MSLDVGALVAHVGIEDIQFQRSYVRLVRQFAELGTKAGAASAGTDRLDASLTDAAVAANAAATGLGRADKAMTEAGLSASEAAAATSAQAGATTEAGLASSKLTQAQLRQVAAQERLTVLQTSGTASVRQLVAAEATLIAANDRVALSQERVGEATGFTSRAWQGLARGLVAGGAVIALGFGVAAHAAMEFDSEMANLRSLAQDASTQEMAALRDAALSVGSAYGYSANQVAEAETELVKAGVSVSDILGGALTGALTLAAAGQEDVAEATATATIAMKQFGLSGTDVPHIADLLAAGADKALGSVSDLSEAFKYGGLAASQAHQSIENTVGTLAEFAQAGLLGSSAGSAMSMALQNLQHASGPAQEAMDKYKISLYNADGTTKSFTQVAGMLHRTLGNLPPAEQQAALATIFTSRARRAATILTRDGAEANREWTETVDDQGFAAQQASGKLDSLSGDWLKLKAAMTAALIGTGEDSQGPLRELVQDVTKVVNAWNSLPAPVRTGVEALIGTAGAVALVAGAAVRLIPKIVAAKAAIVALGTTGSAAQVRMARFAGFMGGPLGIALTAGTIAFGIWASKAADAKARVDELTGAVEADSGAFGENTRAVVANRLEKDGALEVAQRLGLAMSTVTDAALGDAAAQREVARAVAEGSRAHEIGTMDATKLIGSLDKETQAAVDGKEAAKRHAEAVGEQGDAAAGAAPKVDKFGNVIADSGDDTDKATKAAKAYSDQLHAMTDPLFAMNSALSNLREKQDALDKAIRKHGSDSRAAHQAQLDLASSALDVAAASRDLTASVKDGGTSLGEARDMLHSWVKAGLLTKAEAKAVADSFGGLIDKARGVSRELHTAAGNVREAGRAIGVDFGQGMVDGIHSKDGAVRTAAHYQASLLEKYARLATDSDSPSKAAMRVGQDFGSGLAIGVEKSEAKVADAAARLGQKAVDAVRDKLQDARGQLHEDISARAGLSSSIASSLLGSVDLSGAVVNGRVGNLSAFLEAGITPLAKLDKAERRLKHHGANAALLEQVANAGSPEASLALARSILSGRSGSIHHLNALEREARQLAKSTGQTVAGQRYDDDVRQDRLRVERLVQRLDRVNDNLRELQKIAKQQGKDVADAMDESFRGAHHRHHARSGT